MARIIQTADLTPDTQLTQNENDWVYNGLDTMVTLEVLNKITPYLDNMTAATYQFSRDLQGPILEMTTRGMLVDQVRRQEVLALYKTQMKEVEAQLILLLKDGLGLSGDFNWRSPAQLKTLFYGVLDLRPIRKRNANGDYTPTTDREALEKLSSNFFAEPLCIRLLFLRDLEKKRQFLETKIDKDGRIRTNFNIAGTNTGRLASAMSDFGTGGNLQNVDRELRSVFIADPGYKFCNVDLEQADARNYGAICWNNFVESHGEEFAGAYLDACESGDLHTLVCRSAWTGLDWGNDPAGFRAVADRIAYRSFSYRDLAKKLGHGCLTGDHEVLTRNGWTKISNMPSEILTWSREKSEFSKVLNWTHHNYSGLMQHFYSNAINLYMTHDHRVPYLKDINSAIVHEKPACDGPGKYMPLGDRYVGGTESVPARLIAAFMADGHQKSGWMYFHFHKTRKANRLLELCKKYNFKIKFPSKDYIAVEGALPKHPGAFMFNWTRHSLYEFLDELKYWDGHQGKTSTTISSTKLQDLEWYQTFGRIMGNGGNISGPNVSGFGSSVYRLQQNSRRFVSGSSVKHEKTYEQNIAVFCPTVETGWFYVRYGGKICVTGNTNFYGQPPTMAKHTKVERSLIEDFQRRYFKSFPCIEERFKYVRNELTENGYLVSLFRRRRGFFGRPWEDSTLREAVAYDPQSSTADEIDTGLIRLFRAERVQLLVQVHDSILFQFPEELEAEIVPWAIDLLKVRIPLLRGREFYVPTEAKTGWNWGDRLEDKKTGKITNPDGLMKWKGGDTRKRLWRKPSFIDLLG